jgi:hypothetical protein
VKKVASAIDLISLLRRFADAFKAFCLDEISWLDSVGSGTKNSLKKYNNYLNSSFNFSLFLGSYNFHRQIIPILTLLWANT